MKPHTAPNHRVAERRQISPAIAGAAAMEAQRLRELNKEMAALLSTASCTNCDGSGMYAMVGSRGEIEAQQCQWCFERAALVHAGDEYAPQSTPLAAENARLWKANSALMALLNECAEQGMVPSKSAITAALSHAGDGEKS